MRFTRTNLHDAAIIDVDWPDAAVAAAVGFVICRPELATVHETTLQATHSRFDPVLRLGHRGAASRDPLDLASNDYLGLARDPRVVAAAHEALERCGASANASRRRSG